MYVCPNCSPINNLAVQPQIAPKKVIKTAPMQPSLTNIKPNTSSLIAYQKVAQNLINSTPNPSLLYKDMQEERDFVTFDEKYVIGHQGISPKAFMMWINSVATS